MTLKVLCDKKCDDFCGRRIEGIRKSIDLVRVDYSQNNWSRHKIERPNYLLDAWNGLIWT